MDATIASISEATIKQYSKPIRLWWHFCRQNQLSCFRPTITAVLQFLSASLADIGCYSTLNTYRSAISLLTAEEVGSHSLVKWFCKWVAVLKLHDMNLSGIRLWLFHICLLFILTRTSHWKTSLGN